MSTASTNVNPPDHPKNITRDGISSVQSLEPRMLDIHPEGDASALQTLEEERKDLEKQQEEITKQKVHETWLGYLCTQCCLKNNEKPITHCKQINKAIIEKMYQTTTYKEVEDILKMFVFGQCSGDL
eukprot:1484396-Ditylum_brightwellii.AAC.1